ncbi:MAG: DNA repair protein RecO [Flavobacteriales bacterium]
MDKNTQGILLHRFEHSDNSAILKVLTPDEGFCSFIWKGAKRVKKGGGFGSIALPLNRLELTARFKGEDNLHLLKEVRVAEPFQRVIADPERSAIAIFLGEFLYRIAPSLPPDPEFYQELEACIRTLDSKTDPRDLHLHFIARSMIYQGIAPEGSPGKGDLFDLREGYFKRESPPHEDLLGSEQCQILDTMLSKGLGEKERFLKGTSERQDMLRKLIEHHRIHLGEFGKIHSLEVLQEVFSDDSTQPFR